MIYEPEDNSGCMSFDNCIFDLKLCKSNVRNLILTLEALSLSIVQVKLWVLNFLRQNFSPKCCHSWSFYVMLNLISESCMKHSSYMHPWNVAYSVAYSPSQKKWILTTLFKWKPMPFCGQWNWQVKSNFRMW